MKCRYCGYDNTPAPGHSSPDNCEGCGRGIETALRGAPDRSPEDFL